MRLLGSWLLRLGGWRIRGAVPSLPKMVVAIAPHTSNWDFVWLLLAKWQLGLHPKWLGKHTLFRPPLGYFMRRLGGIPVDRTRRGDVVEQAIAEFRRRDRLMLALAPEGTRKRTDHWKSGFYEIALGAGAPIVPVAIDYGRRDIEIGQPLAPTGDRRMDMNGVRAFFAHRRGKRPENQGPVTLKAE